jgi:hypothetical protein
MLHRILYATMHLTMGAFWLAVGALCGWPLLGTALWIGLLALALDGGVYKLSRAMAGR